MNRIVTAGLAVALLSGASIPAMADCAGDLENARSAFSDTLANATKPGADWKQAVAPKNDPPGYTASGGPAPNLPGEGSAQTAQGADEKAPEQQASADAQAPAADEPQQQADAETSAESDSTGAMTAGQQEPAADVSGQPMQQDGQAAPAGEQQMAAAEAGKPMDQKDDPKAAQAVDQANAQSEGNPPSSGDMKGNAEAQAVADLKKEKPSLGLALMDINHAAAYAAAGDEEACMQSLAKAEDTLNAWRQGS